MQVPGRIPVVWRGIAGPLAARLLVLAPMLSGCSLLEDRSERYVQASEGPELKVPDGVDGSRFGQAMPIPPLADGDSRKLFPDDIPRPPDMTSEILQENYVVEELDGHAWLLVNEVPGRLWPQVTAYLNERGLGVAHDSPQLGVMQTEVVNFSKRARDLVELADQPSGAEPRVVLQAKVAPGIRRKTTEIHLTVRTLPDTPDGLLPWEEGPEETLDLQKKLLTDLGSFLKAREESKSFSRAALGLTGEPLVKLVSQDEQPVAIRMELDFGRAWAEVNRALSEARIAIVDLNRSEGWFYVDFRTEDERSSGWFGWFSDAEEPRHTHTLTVREQDGAILVEASKLESYDGEQSAGDLLSRLFEYLY